MQADEQPIASTSKSIVYEEKLNQLLGDLSSIDLSGDIFDESPYIHGRGGFGDVFTGKSRRHGDIAVAVKRLRFYILPENRNGTKLMLRELRIWSSVHHPNVLPLLGYIMHGSYPALISPWMAKGSVRRFMDVNPNQAMAHLAKGVASGLLYLHDQDIIHADLKCDNILLSDSDEPLLADFGISRCLSASISNSSTSPKGSARWMAREFFSSGLSETETPAEHSKETDIWAFGMVLYELLSGLVPFSHLKTDAQVSLAIVQGLTPSRPKSVCEEEDQQRLWTLSQACWREIPFDRPGTLLMYNELHGITNFYRGTVESARRSADLSSNARIMHILRTAPLPSEPQEQFDSLSALVFDPKLHSTLWSSSSLTNPPSAPTTSQPRQRRRNSSKSKRITRPPNAFMLYRQHFVHQRCISDTAETNRKPLSRVVGDSWKQLSASERKVWEDLAKEKKAEHEKDHPNYRSRRKNDSTKGKGRERGDSQTSTAAHAELPYRQDSRAGNEVLEFELDESQDPPFPPFYINSSQAAAGSSREGDTRDFHNAFALASTESIPSAST